MQKGALAAATRANHRHEIALDNVERDVGQRGNGFAAMLEVFADRLKRNHVKSPATPHWDPAAQPAAPAGRSPPHRPPPPHPSPKTAASASEAPARPPREDREWPPGRCPTHIRPRRPPIRAIPP